MFKVYGLMLIIGIVGAIGFGAKYYYDTTQNKIAVLQITYTAAWNARLENTGGENPKPRPAESLCGWEKKPAF